MKNFVIFWERIANSGITYIQADNAKEAIKNLGYNPIYVKMTAIEILGNAEVLTIGKAN